MSGAIEKLGRAYANGGVINVARAIGRRTGLMRTQRNFYQNKVEASLDDRWRMIDSNIPEGSRNLLDIGCNLGEFTVRAASKGMWSLGVEVNEEIVSEAIARHKNVPGCKFIAGPLDPAAAALMPSFDVVLMLSVHHHWHLNYGAEAAAAMLRQIVAATGKAVIFEGPARATRYERDIPDFVENDESSVVGYYDKYLAATVGDIAEVKLIGKSACVGEREPYRWMYAIVK